MLFGDHWRKLNEAAESHSRPLVPMDDFGDDQQTFDTLDAELARIDSKFEKGQMRAFGAWIQMLVSKSTPLTPTLASFCPLP